MKESDYLEIVPKSIVESLIVFKHASNVSIEEYKDKFLARGFLE